MFKRIRPESDCWCGSKKAYKNCHMEFDKKVNQARREGHEIPSHHMIKTPEQIEGIRKSARLNVAVLDYVGEHIKAGVTTEEINTWVHTYTVEHGGIPAPLGFHGFPKSVCTSVNHEVCHGIPSEDVVLKEGDIINVDVSTVLDGYYSDSSRMFIIGETTPEKEQLVRVTKEAVEKGLEQVKPWGYLGDMSQAILDHATKFGYTVVEEIGGHGVGLEFHEDPFVSHVAPRGTEMLMVPGMIFTIEPMVNIGTSEFYMDEENGWTVYTADHKPSTSEFYMDEENGWTVYTADHKPSAQWEVMVLVTENGHEVLAY